jgi:hypothetical protein
VRPRTRKSASSRDSPDVFGERRQGKSGWNGLNLFVTHNIQNGAAAFWSLLLTGRMQEFAGIPMFALLGGIGHVLVIIGCLAIAFDQRITDKRLWKAAAGGVVVLAYLALIVIVAERSH